jgi:hypothetical protein
MSDWAVFLDQVQTQLATLRRSGCDIPLFRGHSDARWKLLCGLGRINEATFKKKDLEALLYSDFLSLAGPLLSRQDSPWDVVFSMQHHGLPTRLLDWSTTFSVALYFALKPYFLDESLRRSLDQAPCIWILNPFDLNLITTAAAVIPNPNLDFDESYEEYFILESKRMESSVVAISPSRTSRRLAAQQGFFTLHASIFTPLEDVPGAFLKQFMIPLTALDDAISFLSLAGMNEYTLFPDLDGLARLLLQTHVR